jgi:hypothetical protein
MHKVVPVALVGHKAHQVVAPRAWVRQREEPHRCACAFLESVVGQAGRHHEDTSRRPLDLRRRVIGHERDVTDRLLALHSLGLHNVVVVVRHAARLYSSKYTKDGLPREARSLGQRRGRNENRKR